MRALLFAALFAAAPSLAGEVLTPHDDAVVTESGSSVSLEHLDQGPSGLLVSRQLPSSSESGLLGEGYLVLDAIDSVLVVQVDASTSLQDVANRINRSAREFSARVIHDMDGVRLFVAVNEATNTMLAELSPLSTQWTTSIASSL